jgi:WD40 repeat protein
MFVLQGAKEQVQFLLFSPDGRTLVAPCGAGVQLWHDLPGGPPREVVSFPRLRSRVKSARFTPDGRKLLLVHRSGLAIQDRSTGATEEVPLSDFSDLECDLSPDGQHAVVAQYDWRPGRAGRLSCLPLARPGSPLWVAQLPAAFYAKPHFLGERRFLLVQWRPVGGGQFVAVYVTRETLTGAAVAEVEAFRPRLLEPVRHLVASPDGRLVAGWQATRVTVFRVADPAARPTEFASGSRQHVTGLAFHPSGRYLAATSNDATVKLFDTATWDVAAAYDWRIGRVRSVCFSPDGMRAAAGGDKGQIVVWDVDL